MDDQTRELIERLERRIQELQDENERLRARVEELERTTARQAAPFRRREARKISPQQRKRPGRKPGHPGACRPVPDHVDEVVDVPLESCPDCGEPVRDAQPLEQYIEEIEPTRPRVVKLTTHAGWCGRCGKAVRSTHRLQTSVAGGAAKVQLGPRALAMGALLNKGCGLTMRTTCKVLHQLTGLRFSPGGLSQAMDRVADKLEGDYEALIGQLRHSPAVFSDETSWWVGGPGWWLWGFTDPQTTVYHVDASRGSQVVGKMLGEDFAGRLVSDCLSSYDPPTCRKHKCIAHHLRAIGAARDRPDTKDPAYVDQWKLLFKAVIALYNARPEIDPGQWQPYVDRIEAWCDRLLHQPVTQSGDLKVRNRLAKQRPHLLGCLYEPAAEPTNNRAERALRPAVIARKLSCGNKTDRGRRTWQILASLATTCHQRTTDFVQYTAPRINLATNPAG